MFGEDRMGINKHTTVDQKSASIMIHKKKKIDKKHVYGVKIYYKFEYTQ